MTTSPPLRRIALGLGAAALAAGLAAPLAPAQSAAGQAEAARAPAQLSPALIRGIQHSLMQGGDEVRAADGVWDELTRSALGDFQRSRGLPASGEPDAHTLVALGLLPGGLPRTASTR